MRKIYFLIIVSALAAQFAAAQSNTDAAVFPVITQYQADQQMMNRKYPLKYSPAYFLRMHKFYGDWTKRLAALPYIKFSVNEKVDYQLLKRDILLDYEELKRNEAEANSVSKGFAWSDIVTRFQLLRSIGKQQDGMLVAADFLKLKTQVDFARSKADDNVLGFTPELYAVAEKITDQYRRVLTESYKFYEGYDPLFTVEVKRSYQDADAALREYSVRLGIKAKSIRQKDDGSGIIGNPIGRDAFIRGLNEEMIAYTPEQIHLIAQREFGWCDKEMLKASNEMGFGNDWKKALEKVKTDYVPQGQQPELIKFLADEAVDFIEKNNLVTVPAMAKEGWSMRMLSAQEQLTAPFFLGGESILIAYPTDGMADTAKMMSMRGNNRHFARATVHHELIPGHNLQYYMQNRYKTYRRAFSTPFWTEGWALYWEMLLWDKKFPQSPENKIGMLFWRMHRCARIIFSTNYHMGKWTPQQCIDFLVDRVGFERANAEAEVRRSFTGNYGPLYQIAYMLGGLQFRALHKELVESGYMTDKQFHDRILKENSMPVEMVRAVLTNQPLPENFQTTWKFAGPVATKFSF